MFLLFFNGASQLHRLKDNFMPKITLVNDKLGYTQIGCQGLFLLDVMLGSIDLFVDIYFKGSQTYILTHLILRGKMPNFPGKLRKIALASLPTRATH